MASLRARLMLGLVGLVVAGLLVAGVVTYAALQSLLIKRVDDQLALGRFTVLHALNDEQEHTGMRGPSSPPDLPGGTYAELRTGDGQVVNHKTFQLQTEPSAPPPPESTARPVVADSDVANAQTDRLVYLTVPGSGGVSRYEVLIERLPPDGNKVLVMAIPLTEVQDTLNYLLTLEAIIGGAVLLGMVGLAWWIIRVGLRPLERIGHTAQAIAHGDLSRRVQPATPRTEIGRLGLALNGMLAQIESAFAERTRSEQRLRRFVADASHELRTPLTSIRGYAELLRRGADRSPQDSALARRRIEQEAVRMSALVDDLLLLARLDQGRPLERAPVDLQAIARDACADAGAVAPARAITLTAPRPLVVSGDEMRLRQVVANLLRNALVHSPPGTPVEVAVGLQGGQAVLGVADHGPGLPDEAAARVFEPFYRADPGRGRDRGGSGLGLRIVAAVVAAHGGHVETSSTPGGGATFRVFLPLPPAQPAGSLTANSEAPPRGA
jgi:two-component system OmpR family sensor kinase